jgi:Anaphase-promoting complex, subunit 10 (APC10)
VWFEALTGRSPLLFQKLSIFLSYRLDDSYTPAALSVRAGTSPGDLQEVRAVTLDRPDGWITFDVSAEPSDDGEGLSVSLYLLSVFFWFTKQVACFFLLVNRYTLTSSKSSYSPTI